VVNFRRHSVMGLVNRIQNSVFDPWNELRAQRRTRFKIRGTILFPEKQYEQKCLVLDLSPDGAGLKSACSPVLSSRVVLYVDGLGRFEGTIIRQDRLHVGVQFKYSEAMRERIAGQISIYRQHGPLNSPATRDWPRLCAAEIPHSFVRESGQTQLCDISDIALSGASFISDIRPDVGERVFFGKAVAVVVRHTEEGFAVTFSD
jgi:PilZ domain